MFNNLIESSSHSRELKRRGSFLLFTTATYALLFVAAGVISIYAYEARLQEQNLELVTIMPLVDLPAPVTEPPRATPATPPRATTDNERPQNYYERAVAMASVNNPNVAPTTVSTAANTNLPLPTSGIVRFTGRDLDPSGAPGTRPGTGNSAGNTRPTVVNVDTLPPAPEPKPVPRKISKGVITSDAISLPKPAYPPIAVQAGARGRVSVQVLIDEHGKVIHAQAISGHPLLTASAVRAAYQARFSPTLLSGEPVKVSGVINYDFQR